MLIPLSPHIGWQPSALSMMAASLYPVSECQAHPGTLQSCLPLRHRDLSRGYILTSDKLSFKVTVHID